MNFKRIASLVVLFLGAGFVSIFVTTTPGSTFLSQSIVLLGTTIVVTPITGIGMFILTIYYGDNNTDYMQKASEIVAAACGSYLLLSILLLSWFAY
jgi:hypothetical protein